MIEEHSKVNEDLKQLAAKKNVSIPIKPGEKDLKQVKELSSLQGSNFDKAYMKTIVQNHEKDIARFQIQAEKGKDPEIKAFATNTLSDLLLQLEVATTINNSLKED
jgi:putative membrane protein